MATVEIAHFGSLAGSKSPGDPSKRWGAKPPTVWRGLPGPRGRPDLQNERFLILIKIKKHPPKVQPHVYSEQYTVCCVLCTVGDILVYCSADSSNHNVPTNGPGLMFYVTCIIIRTGPAPVASGARHGARRAERRPTNHGPDLSQLRLRPKPK